MSATQTQKLEALQHELKSYESQFQAAKAEFVARVETNPAYAIEWGSSMVEAQGRYEAAYHLIGNDLTADAVRKTVEELGRRIRRSHGTSTSALSNGVEYLKWTAAVSVLERLEGFLEYFDKAV